MRKIYLIIAVFVLSMVSVHAETKVNYEITDYVNNTIKIKMTTDEAVSGIFTGLTISQPGIDINTINKKDLTSEEHKKYFAYQGQGVLRNSKCEFEIKLNPLAKDNTQNYNIYSFVNGHLINMPLYFYNRNDIYSFIGTLYDVDETNNAQLLKANDDFVRYLSLNNKEIYQNLYSGVKNKEDLFRIFLDEFKSYEGNEEETDDIVIFENIKDMYMRALITESYNEANKSLVKNGKLIYTDKVGFDKNQYVYDYIENKITEQGLKALIDNMSATKCKTTDELLKNLEKNMIFAGINYPVTEGFGHITEILNSSEAQKIMKDNKMAFNVSSWNSADKREVSRQYFLSPAKNTEDMIKKLNELSKKNPASGKKPGGNGGGGSGSSGGSGGKVTPPSPSNVITPNTNVPVVDVFVDLGNVQWAKKSIMALYTKGAINGVTDNEFRPSDNITREQFVKILVAALDMKLSDKESSFRDVLKDQWYYKYVVTAAENNIVNGISDDLFGIGDYVTKEQIAAMCYRTLGNKNTAPAEDFNDSSDISDYAKESVMSMRSLGIIKGDDNNNFLPKKYATRAEAAQIIYGLLNVR